METIKLLLVFVAMLVLLWRKVPMAPVIAGASTVLALLYGTDLLGFMQMIWGATKSPDTIEIMAILVVIMILERILRDQGYLERILNALTGLFRDRRTVMGILPAFIGLMPSAGGALFSAPLVEQAVGKTVSAEEKAFINFYYRHIWEFLIPIYPGVLLASSISGIPLSNMLLGVMPFGLIMIFLGIPFLFSIKVDDEIAASKEMAVSANSGSYTSDHTARKQLMKDIVFSTLPVVVVVGLVLASVNAVLATTVVVVTLLIRHRYNPDQFFTLVRKALVVKTLLILWAVMFFKEVMSTTGAIDSLPILLAGLPIPEIAVAGLISFIIAYLTGQSGFYVGIAFPVALAAVGGQMSLTQAVFIFVSGAAGTMLSPMHLCFTLTLDYFKADFGKVVGKLLITESILVAIAFGAYVVFG